jgi:hypothetical protein
VATSVTQTIQMVLVVLFATMVQVLDHAVQNLGVVISTRKADSAALLSGPVIQTVHVQHRYTLLFLQDYLPATAVLLPVVLRTLTDLPTGQEWDITNSLTH